VLYSGCQRDNGNIIGDNVMFGPGVKIIRANHDVSNKDRRWIKKGQ
jgi:acetyltransferase-like isoleucine patch superfamily enzyme